MGRKGRGNSMILTSEDIEGLAVRLEFEGLNTAASDFRCAEDQSERRQILIEAADHLEFKPRYHDEISFRTIQLLRETARRMT
jgi:hypothetical protein